MFLFITLKIKLIFIKCYLCFIIKSNLYRNLPMNMHVFCPDCKAEYQVSERSNARLTVKFICYKCKSSWIDSPRKEKSEGNEEFEETNENGMSALSIDDLKNQSQLLSSLALAEIDNSFGLQNSDKKLLANKEKSDVTFNFETAENFEIATENGPTQNFPDLKRQSDTSKEENANSVEKRNNKEIEIEKRLRESTELLKKAREDTGSDTPAHATQKKDNRLILYISSILVFLIFSASLMFIFGEEIVTRFPVAEQLVTKIYYYSDIIFGLLKNIYFKISQFFLTTLA